MHGVCRLPAGADRSRIRLVADLGANVGLSVWYRLRRLPQCRVIALGPHPRRMTPSDEGTASTLTDAAERGLPVEVADIFALLAGRRVDLPKLDVEGGEYELLEDPLRLGQACAVLFDEGTPDAAVRAAAFEAVTPDALRAAMARVKELARPEEGSPYVAELRGQARRLGFLPSLLRAVRFGCVPAARAVLDAVEHLRAVAEGRPAGKPPLAWIPKGWRDEVVRTDGGVDMAAYGVCLLLRMCAALRQRDLHAAPSQRYADPREGLLEGAAWEAARPAVCRSLAPTYLLDGHATLFRCFHLIEVCTKPLAARLGCCWMGRPRALAVQLWYLSRRQQAPPAPVGFDPTTAGRNRVRHDRHRHRHRPLRDRLPRQAPQHAARRGLLP